MNDPVIAEKLCPDYPIGTRRLILEIDYYECFNRDNVTLVDMREDPIEEITETGIRTQQQSLRCGPDHLCPGLPAVSSAPSTRPACVNEKGQTPRETWARGPRTVFGLMTPGFPNLFHPTNAGSPSVLGPLILENEFHVDWIADCIEHMRAIRLSPRSRRPKRAPTRGGASPPLSRRT